MLGVAPPNAAAGGSGGKPLNPAVANLLPSVTVATASNNGALMGMGGAGAGAGKMPRLSRSRASSFYGAIRPVPVSVPSSVALSASASSSNLLPPSAAPPTIASAKPRFVLDPSSLHGVPSGHPSVPPLPSTPQPLGFLLPPGLLPSSLSSSSSAPAQAPPSTSAGAGAAATGGAGGLSPKSLSLRNALFPELASSSSAAPTPAGATTPSAAGPGTPAAATAPTAAGPVRGGADGNGTTDIGESDTEDDRGESATPAPPAQGLGVRVKAAPPPGGGGGGAGGQGGNEREKEAGRKLWEVVDSVGLLEGVLQ